MDLPNQTGEPLPAHLRRRHRPLLVLVVAGAADPEEAAAELGPMTGPHDSVDHQVNPFWPGPVLPKQLRHLLQNRDFFQLPNAFLRFRQLDTPGRREPGAS